MKSDLRLQSKTHTHRADLIRHAIVGAGRIGSLLEKDPLREKPCTHAGAIHSIKGSVLVACCDTDPARLTQFQADWGVSALYTDYNVMLNEVPIDILHIATHPDTHYEIALAAKNKGIPVVVCEKPLADTLEKGRALAALTQLGETCFKVVVNHERRYSLDYIKAASIVSSGLLGKLCSVRGRVYGGMKKTASEVLLHDGTHLIDSIRFLTGRNFALGSTCSGEKETPGSTLFVSATLLPHFEGGDRIPVSIEAGSGRNYFEFGIELSFSQGHLSIGNGFFNLYRSAPSGYSKGFHSLKIGEKYRYRKTGYFRNMVLDARSVFQNRDQVPLSSANDGLASIELILGVIS